MEERLLELEKRLDKAVSTIEKHNFLLESLLVNREKHAEEHQFIRELIEEKKVKNEIKRKVLANLASAGTLTFFAALLSALGILIKEWFIS